MDRTNLALTILLIVMTLGSWLLAQREALEELRISATGHTPDYYLEDFGVTNMNAQGQPDKYLTAERMVHYPDDDSTELTHPKMVIYDGDRPPWKVISESGWISGDGELLLLHGEVTIDRLAAPEVRPLHLVTRDLRIRMQENYAETDQHVDARSLQDHVVSDGLQAWFNKPIRLKFLSNVRGRHEVN